MEHENNKLKEQKTDLEKKDDKRIKQMGVLEKDNNVMKKEIQKLEQEIEELKQAK